MATTNQKLSPSRGDKSVTSDPARPAPDGFVYVLLYRRTRHDAWIEVLREATAERLWLRSLEVRLSGHFMEKLVPVDLFDPAEGAKG